MGRNHIRYGSILLSIPILLSIVHFTSCGGSSGSAPASAAPWTLFLGTAGDDSGNGLATDPAGNVLLTGTTSGSLDGAPFSGSTDLYLAKYGPSGEKAWILQRGPAGGTAIAIDSGGNLYVAGSTDSPFDNNAFFGASDVILAKFDAAGSWLWSAQFGTSDSDVPNAIAVDGNGNVFVAGSTYGDLGGKTHAGLGDAFLAKIDPGSGGLVWVELIGTPFFEVGEGVATDNSGRVFVCGLTFHGDVEGTGSPPGAEDIFVASFLDNGTSAVREWIRQHGTEFDEYPVAIGFFDGTLYVAGYADDDIGGNVNQGGWDAFLWRFNGADGSPVGVTFLGSAEHDFAENIAIDTAGNVYMAGRTNGDLAGTNADPASDPNLSTHDVFLAKFGADGALLWARQVGTSENDYGYAVAADNAGSVYVTGITKGNLDGKTNAGGWDAFLLKYDGSGNRQ